MDRQGSISRARSESRPRPPLQGSRALPRPVERQLLPAGVSILEHDRTSRQALTDTMGATTGVFRARGRGFMENRIHPAHRDHSDLLVLRLETPFQDGGRGLTHQRDVTVRKPPTHHAHQLVRPHPDGRVPRAQAFAHAQRLVARTHTNDNAHRCVVQGSITTIALTIQCTPELLPERSVLDRALSRECPRVLIGRPQRRSSVSSMTRSTHASAGTTGSTISRSTWRRTASGDQRARVRT
jgi:hypothetical protein